MSQRVLTEAERRETVTETMASWALEGMQPTQRDLDEILAYVAGDIDEEGLIARAKAEFGA